MAAAGAAELLCYIGGTLTNPTLSKTLSLLSSPFPTSPILHLRTPSLSLHRASPLPCFLSRLSATDLDISLTDDDEQEGELLDDSDGAADFDVDALEEDALFTVRDFSSFLSKQLTIEDEKTDQEEIGRKQRRQKSIIKSDGFVHIYDLQTGQWVSSFQAALDTFNGFSFHPFLPMATSSSGHRRFLAPDDGNDELHLSGDENCASVWSFSVASMVENDVEIDADDHNNSQNLLQNP